MFGFFFTALMRVQVRPQGIVECSNVPSRWIVDEDVVPGVVIVGSDDLQLLFYTIARGVAGGVKWRCHDNPTQPSSLFQ